LFQRITKFAGVTRESKMNYGIYGNGTAVSDIDHNTEAYNAINENGYKNVTTNPLSTFSVDVDAASYSNARRFIVGWLQTTS
jgi:Ca-activated chloride channel family protein